MSDPASDWGEFAGIGQIPIVGKDRKEEATPPGQGVGLVAALRSKAAALGLHSSYLHHSPFLQLAAEHEARWQAELLRLRARVQELERQIAVLTDKADDAAELIDALRGMT